MFNEIIYRPLYNGLVALMNIPGIDIGMAVILFTVIVRLILFPLSKKALLTQVRMKEVEPELNRIKTQYANDRQLQGQKMMELYKSHKISPFAGVLLMLIQLPILIGLISVFYKVIPIVDKNALYSFIPISYASPTLLGLDLTQKSLVLALLTGVIQFIQLHFSLASHQQRVADKKATDSGAKKVNDFASSMNSQMKYFMPVLAFISVYWIIPSRYPEAATMIAIYWSVSTLFTLGQELYIRKKHLH